MVTISITAEAFAAIEATLPKGMRGEARPDGKGGLFLALPDDVLNKLKALGLAGESYSDVILRIAKGD
jgi:hypothetical protein